MKYLQPVSMWTKREFLAVARTCGQPVICPRAAGRCAKSQVAHTNSPFAHTPPGEDRWWIWSACGAITIIIFIEKQLTHFNCSMVGVHLYRQVDNTLSLLGHRTQQQHSKIYKIFTKNCASGGSIILSITGSELVSVKALFTNPSSTCSQCLSMSQSSD